MTGPERAKRSFRIAQADLRNLHGQPVPRPRSATGGGASVAGTAATVSIGLTGCAAGMPWKVTVKACTKHVGRTDDVGLHAASRARARGDERGRGVRIARRDGDRLRRHRISSGVRVAS